MEEIKSRILTEKTLSPWERIILVHLLSKPQDGMLSQKGLSELLGAGQSIVERAMRRMVKMNVVSRRRGMVTPQLAWCVTPPIIWRLKSKKVSSL